MIAVKYNLISTILDNCNLSNFPTISTVELSTNDFFEGINLHLNQILYFSSFNPSYRYLVTKESYSHLNYFSTILTLYSSFPIVESKS